MRYEVEMDKDAMRRLDEIREGAGEIPTEEVVRWIREDRERSPE